MSCCSNRLLTRVLRRERELCQTYQSRTITYGDFRVEARRSMRTAHQAAVVDLGSTRRTLGTADTTAQGRERARQNRGVAPRDPLRGTPGRPHREQRE